MVRSRGMGPWPALARGRRLGRSSVPLPMAPVLSCELPPAQVLLDLQQRRIRWRVLLVPRPDDLPLVLIEKIGKGGRVLHQHRVLWSRLHPVDFIHPRRQVSGGVVPRCLVERVEALLRGAPLPRRRREWRQVHGRLVRRP
jgi:hypothetical protein